MNVGAGGGTLRAPGWWPTRQPTRKPHILKCRHIWFMVYGGQVFAWRLGNPLFFHDHQRVKPS